MRQREHTAQMYAPSSRGFRRADETHRQLRADRTAEGWDGHHSDYPPGPRGLRYVCQSCGRDFRSPQGARKHERLSPGCVVLRVDWLESGYLELLREVVRRAEA